MQPIRQLIADVEQRIIDEGLNRFDIVKAMIANTDGQDARKTLYDYMRRADMHTLFVQRDHVDAAVQLYQRLLAVMDNDPDYDDTIRLVQSLYATDRYQGIRVQVSDTTQDLYCGLGLNKFELNLVESPAGMSARATVNSQPIPVNLLTDMFLNEPDDGSEFNSTVELLNHCWKVLSALAETRLPV